MWLYNKIETRTDINQDTSEHRTVSVSRKKSWKKRESFGMIQSSWDTRGVNISGTCHTGHIMTVICNHSLYHGKKLSGNNHIYCLVSWMSHKSTRNRSNIFVGRLKKVRKFPAKKDLMKSISEFMNWKKILSEPWNLQIRERMKYPKLQMVFQKKMDSNQQLWV